MIDRRPPAPDDERVFLAVIFGSLIMGLAAVGLGSLANVPLAPQLLWSPNAIAIGIIATLPLALFLFWFSVSENPAIARLRHSQTEFIARIGFALTPPRIIAIAAVAGVTEEALFRGVMQPWLEGRFSIVPAILLSNMIFGALHFRTLLYAAIAGCVGVYLGVLYHYTNNLLAPIITHGVYDYIALEYARRTIAARLS